MQMSPDYDFCIEAGNGQQLIDQIAECAVVPDLCLLDLNMPVLDGYETLLILKQRWPQIKVLVLTSHHLEYQIIRTLKAGACGYLHKECGFEELMLAITNVHHTGIHFSQKVTASFFQSVMRNEIEHPEFNESELRFLKYCCTDLSYQQIAEAMCLSPKTIEWYSGRMFKKLNTTSRVGLVIRALRIGVVVL